MRKKFTAVLLSALLVVCAMPATASAWTETYDMTPFTGSDCTSNKTAAATIDYVLNKYKHQTTYPGSGECWGYAEKVSTMLASSRETKKYTGLKFNKTNFKNKCLGVKAGTHIRLGNEKSFNAWKGHSVVLLKVTEEQVIWADNNYSWDNTVSYYSGTMDDFLWFYGYTYLQMVSKPVSYKTYREPQVSSGIDGQKGGVRLTWLKTTGTTRYEVYRSYSKNSGYKRIAKTSKTSYTDSSVTLGKTAYYKIKAVKSSGSKYSNVTSRAGKLATPQASWSSDETTGYIVLSWKAVPKADRYAVYRYDYTSQKYKLIKKTTECSFTDTAAVDGMYYFYKIRAVCDANSKGNSSLALVNYCFYDPPYDPGDDDYDDYGDA